MNLQQQSARALERLRAEVNALESTTGTHTPKYPMRSPPAPPYEQDTAAFSRHPDHDNGYGPYVPKRPSFEPRKSPEQANHSEEVL